MSLLSTHNLGKHYAGLQAVNNVSFELPEGQIRALIGPNGAGKTTFVGMLCGRIEPSSGEVYFAAENISRLPAHKRIGLGIAYSFQITSVFSNLPVAENIALAVRARQSLSERELLLRTETVLERVGLTGSNATLAGDMSYGHQRLLEIAMGLAQSPRLFILDEPTQGLAESEIDLFKQLLAEVAADTTILLIEHNMDVVMETAGQITVLDAGRVLAEGTPAEIQSNPAVQAAYLGTGNA